jgi:hypothetical protein
LRKQRAGLPTLTWREEEGEEGTACVGLLALISSVLGEMDPEPASARCGEADPIVGDMGPDRREGVGETETHPPRQVEEDHDPPSPPPQTMGGGALGRHRCGSNRESWGRMSSGRRQ